MVSTFIKPMSLITDKIQILQLDVQQLEDKILCKSRPQTEFLRKQLEQSFNIHLSECASAKDLIKMLQTELDAKILLLEKEKSLKQVQMPDINETDPMKIKVLLVKQNKQIEILSQ